MAESFKIIIIDDEPTAVNALKAELESYKRFNIEGIAYDGKNGIKLINEIKPDLLFLDIELPDMYGMEVISEISNKISWDMRTVFYTAYNKYMINALRNYAFDFLLKPIDKKEFDIVISRFIIDREKITTLPDRNIISEFSKVPFMVVTPTGDLRMLKISEIGFFRYVSSRKIWEAVLTTGENIALKRNTSAEFLCNFDESFVQVHQSYIINMNFLIMLQDNRCIMYPPFDKCTEISVSRKYKKAIMERFCIF